MSSCKLAKMVELEKRLAFDFYLKIYFYRNTMFILFKRNDCNRTLKLRIVILTSLKRSLYSLLHILCMYYILNVHGTLVHGEKKTEINL